jgi:hypothetical protein
MPARPFSARDRAWRAEALSDAGDLCVPDDIKIIVTAFEDTLRALRLVDRKDPATAVVAKRIIALAQQGERDPIRLREGAMQGLSPSGRE